MDLSEGGEGGDAATSNTSQSPPLPPPRSQSPTSPPTRKLHLRLGLTDYKTFRGEDDDTLLFREEMSAGQPLRYLRCLQGAGRVVPETRLTGPA